MPDSLQWVCLSPGVYDDTTGRVTMYRIEGCTPAAWNVEWTTDYQYWLATTDSDYTRDSLALTMLVDGAASWRDAKALAAAAWPTLRARAQAIEQAAAAA